MEIYLATDHAGFAAKEKLVSFLQDKGYRVKDFGAHEFNSQDDYPDFIVPLARSLVQNNHDDVRAFIFGGSGQGEAMVANRFVGVRAAVVACEDERLVVLAREHNNANVLSFGARFVGDEFIARAALLFIETSFSESPRHLRRLNKLMHIHDN